MRFVEERETLRRQQFKPTVAASKEVFKSCEVCVSVLRQKKLFSWIFKSCWASISGPRRAVRLDFRNGVILCLHRSYKAWISVLSRMGAARLDLRGLPR